jgi:hypothetical protein
LSAEHKFRPGRLALLADRIGSGLANRALVPIEQGHFNKDFCQADTSRAS